MYKIGLIDTSQGLGLMDLTSNIQAWIAVGVSVVLLAERIRTYIKENRKDRAEIRRAISTESQVKDQLDLGNTKEAVLILRSMMKQQQEFFVEREAQRDKREDELEGELQEVKIKNRQLEREVEVLRLEVRELRQGA